MVNETAFYDIIEQPETGCMSITTKLKISEYLKFVEHVYRKNGGIAGQRGALKTKTAITIRNRMVIDIANGAILPPVVLGVHIKDSEWDLFLHSRNFNELMEKIGDPELGRVSVIDGMQRTTAILEAVSKNENVNEKYIRVEFWISKSLNNLIYRMLVLNTGQVPWDISRQLSTIYKPLLMKIEDKLSCDGDVKIIDKFGDERQYRTKFGQYKNDEIIQLLLHFSSGKYELDLKDKITEDFTRLDMIESSSHERFIDLFADMIMWMTTIDMAFSYINYENDQSIKFKKGADIFKSYPARVGFCVAVSNFLFDDPGVKVDWDESEKQFKTLHVKFLAFTDKISSLTPEEQGTFLDLSTLDYAMSGSKSQVGRVERKFFTEAFSYFINKMERIESMTPCWRKP
ncbi:hypothetical protein ACK30Y_02250 [Aeromonas caviae]